MHPQRYSHPDLAVSRFPLFAPLLITRLWILGITKPFEEASFEISVAVRYQSGFISATCSKPLQEMKN